MLPKSTQILGSVGTRSVNLGRTGCFKAECPETTGTSATTILHHNPAIKYSTSEEGGSGEDAGGFFFFIFIELTLSVSDAFRFVISALSLHPHSSMWPATGSFLEVSGNTLGLH
jgi:hypothetical protein